MKKTKIKKSKKAKFIEVELDPEWPLSKWLLVITDLIETYGADSILSTDGGCNNVSLVLERKDR